VKGRDLLIIAGVLLLGGFALADALRESATSEPREARPPTTTEPATTSTQEDEGPERFPAVPGAGGNFVFTEVGSCPVREVDLPTGLVYLNLVRASTCELWGAPVTAKVAVGIGAVGDAIPFRFLDLSRPNRELGGGEALFGGLVWSEDGQRAAWCNGQRIGFDLELGGPRRILPDCPSAYSPEGDIVYARGDRLFVEDRPGLQASGTITKVHYGSDGSLAVVVEGRRIERYVDGELTDALDLEERYHGRLPTLSPDNCSVALSAGEQVRILDVGCSRLGPNVPRFPGRVAAWSPNGDWIAIGGPRELTFYDLTTDAEPVVWPVGAVQLAWRRS
jgi:hypothetical protein